MYAFMGRKLKMELLKSDGFFYSHVETDTSRLNINMNDLKLVFSLQNSILLKTNSLFYLFNFCSFINRYKAKRIVKNKRENTLL